MKRKGDINQSYSMNIMSVLKQTNSSWILTPILFFHLNLAFQFYLQLFMKTLIQIISLVLLLSLVHSQLVSQKAKGIARQLISQYEHLSQPKFNQAVNKAIREFGRLLLKLNAVRTAVVIDMMYTLGTLKEWKKLMKEIQKKDFIKAGQEILDSRYARQLQMRAKRNADLMKLGKLQGIRVETVEIDEKCKEKGMNLIRQYEEIENEEALSEKLEEQVYPQLFQYWGNLLKSLNCIRIAVLIDMTYTLHNLHSWKAFTSALHGLNFSLAAQQILNSKYAQQYPKRAQRNSNLMKSGDNECQISEKARQIAIRLIKEGQGLRLQKYIDTEGHPTIGYGHKILEGENFDEPITKEQAEELLKKDLKKAQNEVFHYWGQTLNSLREERVAVLIDMTFNLGSLRKWPKMRAAILDANYQKASQEILNSKYAKQTGVRAERNAGIMRDGVEYNIKNYPK